MSSPSQTEAWRIERLDPRPAEPMPGDTGFPDDRLRQQFFVEWEVPQTPVASDYEGRPGLPVDLRGTGALLVDDVDLLTG